MRIQGTSTDAMRVSLYFPSCLSRLTRVLPPGKKVSPPGRRLGSRKRFCARCRVLLRVACFVVRFFSRRNSCSVSGMSVAISVCSLWLIFLCGLVFTAPKSVSVFASFFPPTVVRSLSPRRRPFLRRDPKFLTHLSLKGIQGIRSVTPGQEVPSSPGPTSGVLRRRIWKFVCCLNLRPFVPFPSYEIP